MTGDERADAELLLAAAAGDGSAFAVLVRRHIRAATLLAAQLLGDQDDAEDIVQVAFTIVYDRARSFDTGRPFAPWLYGIVRRLAANRVARDARRARLMKLWGRIRGGGGGAGGADGSGAIAEASVGPLEIDAMNAAMSQLSPMQRACFELVAVRGISTGEVAAMHDISESTVRQHVFRARSVMQRELGTADTTPAK